MELGEGTGDSGLDEAALCLYCCVDAVHAAGFDDGVAGQDLFEAIAQAMSER